MKRFLLLAMLASPSIYAYDTCVAELETAEGRFVQQFFAEGRDLKEACRNALRECNREKLLLERNNVYRNLRCETGRGGTRPPVPNPTPIPTPRPSNYDVLTGDQVIPDSYSQGYANVIALFPNEVVTRGNFSSSNARYRFDQIALTSGCLLNNCVGDEVIPDTYNQGTARIKAINFSKETLTTLGNFSTTYGRYTERDVAQTKGCLGSICVGQKVIPNTYNQGVATVKAINFAKQTFTTMGNFSSTYGRYQDIKLAETSGCLSGICVGDRVLPRTFNQGYAVVKAINFLTGEFTVMGNFSSSYGRYRAQDLARL